MRLYVDIQINNVIYSSSLLCNNSLYDRITIDNEFIIDVFKVHNHSYYFKAFFYNSKRIYSPHYFSTKSKLYTGIQNLLEEELYHVIHY